MSNKIIVHKNRTNVILVDLGIDITGDTITSQVRAEQDHTSELITSFTVAVTDAATGMLTLTIDDTLSGAITVDSGYMDIRRVSGGEPVVVLDRPLEVEFRGTVTA